MNNNKELELINMIQELQTEQAKYWSEKRKYGNSSTQLEICKRKEKELKDYCKKRLVEIGNESITKQQYLFT